MKIFDILPVGEENAISAKALSAKLGLSVRECRARISKELQEGSFIKIHHGKIKSTVLEKSFIHRNIKWRQSHKRI